MQNAIKEVSKGECITTGYFNNGHIEWKSLESTECAKQHVLLLIQDSFLTQHVLSQPGERMYYISSSQNELVDNVRIHQPLRNRDHH